MHITIRGPCLPDSALACRLPQRSPCPPPHAAQNGHTPLHEAAEKGHVEVAALLVDKGADVKAINEVLGDRAGAQGKAWRRYTGGW